ncbi:50S ribosomal protein L15 [Mycoplasma tauri]|uniref:50S ribosomal protein L15 n=1 Tax=Mycoplasma tauri TaxID=547987 RepID=UPI00196864CC|nr:50S ribosomal protein L15 [Mycoplasma tauri]MBZ4203544.1 50S ribosomal protein L15 [Mycoplasma tauri]MBZ4204470.1 50S ribosomal protein L15 [Mycoplasma tauri]MBZ4212589.1 50S ribosomal protein L15 [Mycoplasma tauri]MBZ4218221.1 50S ribosomal protein L15 [Mycoplasma tauri]MBZ4227014.1 50S ribosomal protein L15 [Mycoplasma tauri]
MKLNNLKPTPGSRVEKHRVGRGHAAGKGKQAGKGQSGQNKRHGHRLGFEGGQTPWFRRIGKRGFTNVNHVEYQVINLADLEKTFKTNTNVDLDALFAANLIKRNLPVKLLGNGSLTKKLNVTLHAASKSAIDAIEKAGGKFTNL